MGNIFTIERNRRYYGHQTKRIFKMTSVEAAEQKQTGFSNCDATVSLNCRLQSEYETVIIPLNVRGHKHICVDTVSSNFWCFVAAHVSILID